MVGRSAFIEKCSARDAARDMIKVGGYIVRAGAVSDV